MSEKKTSKKLFRCWWIKKDIDTHKKIGYNSRAVLPNLFNMSQYKKQNAWNQATYQVLHRQFEEKLDTYRNSRGKYRKGYDDICSQIYLYLSEVFSSSMKHEVKITTAKKEYIWTLEAITRFDSAGPCLKIVQNGVIELVGIEKLASGVQKFEVWSVVAAPVRTALQKVK